MFGLFAVSTFFLVVFGTNADHCIEQGFSIKECSAYVAEQAEPTYEFNQ